MSRAPLPLRLMMTDHLPAGTAICLACGWRRDGLAHPHTAARDHNRATRHPTMAPIRLAAGDATGPEPAGSG